MISKKLDARGLNCPMPILKAKQALSDLAHGQRLEVTCTDPGSVEDFEAFCRTTGNGLVESNRVGSDYRYVIERGS